MANRRDPLPGPVHDLEDGGDLQDNYHAYPVTHGCDSMTYQLNNTSSRFQGNVVQESAPDSHYSLLVALQKRSVRLMKNRKAVQEFRQRKKQYIETLEFRAAKLQKENKALAEELEALKSKYGFKFNI